MSAVNVIVLTMTLSSATPVDITDAYTCGVGFDVDGLGGGMWRHFYPGHPDDFYIIQLQNPRVLSGPFAFWHVDNRPPAPPRVYGYQFGWPESVAFSLGPESVSFGTIEHGEVRDGRIWIRLFGDGVYAGTFLRQTARRTRQAYRRGERALSAWVSRIHYPEIVAQLANAQEWRAVLLDDSGRELGSKTVRVPAPAQVQSEFLRRRAALLSARDAYLAGAQDGGDPAASCERMSTDEETI
jgi:hypothetical protein